MRRKARSGLVKAGDLLRSLALAPPSPAQQKLIDAAAAIRLNPDAAEAAYMARQLA